MLLHVHDTFSLIKVARMLARSDSIRRRAPRGNVRMGILCYPWRCVGGWVFFRVRNSLSLLFVLVGGGVQLFLKSRFSASFRGGLGGRRTFFRVQETLFFGRFYERTCGMFSKSKFAAAFRKSRLLWFSVRKLGKK